MPTAVTACPHRTYFARPRWTRDITERRASTVLSMSTGEDPSARQVRGHPLASAGWAGPCSSPSSTVVGAQPVARAIHRSGQRGQGAVVLIRADQVDPPL